MYFLAQHRRNYVRKLLHTHNLDIGSGETPITSDSICADIRLNGISSTHLPYLDKSFDSVTTLELFEHLKEHDLVKTLEEIIRVMKCDSQLIVTMPYSDGIWKHIQRLIWFIRERTTISKTYYKNTLINGHINLMSTRNLKDLLVHSGFTIIKAERVLFYDYMIVCIK